MPLNHSKGVVTDAPTAMSSHIQYRVFQLGLPYITKKLYLYFVCFTLLYSNIYDCDRDCLHNFYPG